MPSLYKLPLEGEFAQTVSLNRYGNLPLDDNLYNQEDKYLIRIEDDEGELYSDNKVLVAVYHTTQEMCTFQQIFRL